MNVLYIEDTAEAIRLVARVVRHMNGTVTIAETGAAGLQYLEVAPNYDVVLCDLGLPDFDGVDLVQQLHTKFPQLLIVAVTGYAMHTERSACFEAGCTAYLAKPFQPHELEHLLRDLLGTSASSSGGTV